MEGYPSAIHLAAVQLDPERHMVSRDRDIKEEEKKKGEARRNFILTKASTCLTKEI